MYEFYEKAQKVAQQLYEDKPSLFDDVIGFEADLRETIWII